MPFCKDLFLKYNKFIMSEINLDIINQLVSEKKFEEAKELLAEFLDKDEKNVEALKLLGLCHVNLNEFKEGQSVFETVVKYKDDASSWFYLANCYDNLEDYLHAIPAYQEVIRLRDNYIDAYKNLAVVHVKNKEPEKAVELCKKALEFETEDYTLYYIAGTAYMSMKKFEESLFYLENALRLNPNHSQLYNNLGTSYVTIGNLEKAYENFIKASELDSDNSITYYNIASILQLQNKHDEACEYFEKAYEIEPQDSYIVALALSEVKAKKFDKAISHYKLLISHHPEKPNFQYNLACCYEMTGEYNYAIGILAHLVLLNPKSVTMSQKLANLYMKINKPLNAKEIYEKIILSGSVSFEIYYEFAHICAKTGDIDKAEKILKKVIDLNPEYAPAHKDLGVLYLRKRLFDYAEDEFNKALNSAPDDFSIVFEYANYLHSTTDFKKADEYYQKSLELKPDDVDALGFSALNKIHLKDFENAFEQVQEAIKKAPDMSFLYYIAGKIKFLQEQYEDAKFYLIKSYEKDKNHDVENLLGLCYYELSSYEQANQIFEDMLKENPLNVNLLLSSARCMEKMDNIDKALELCERITDAFPECEEAQEMIRRIS